MTTELREALAELGELMPPVRTTDLWRAGRRQRRRARIRAAMATAAVLALVATVPVLALRGPAPVAPAVGEAAVPGRLWLPWMWQATVQQDPNGPATVLFSGDPGPPGGGLLRDERAVVVVGRDGSYRVLLPHGDANWSNELSPDGRYVVHATVDSRSASIDQSAASAPDGWLLVTDLTTGRIDSYQGRHGTWCCAQPLAWTPDGRSVLAVDHNEWYDEGPQLVLLDLTTRESTPLFTFRDGQAPTTVAFSRDAQQLAVSVPPPVDGSDSPGGLQQLTLMDRAGRTLWTTNLQDAELAGSGAFHPGGRLLVTKQSVGCCDGTSETWQFGYLDAATGAEAVGPALPTVTGLEVEALGWRYGHDLVVIVYEPGNGRDWSARHAKVLALRPDGVVETLLDPPDEVTTVRVPLDLVEAGRFGGPAVKPAVFPARPFSRDTVVALILLSLVVVVSVRLWRRHRNAVQHG